MHVGDVVADRFEILESAGSGGMGVVYQARDRSTGAAVALKVLADREQAPADRFAQEIELLSAIDHPHIVGYVTSGVTKSGAPFLVMPWLDGVDLQERLKHGPLSIDDTVTIAQKISGALACLHGRGLVHRDLKPSNLFLCGRGVDEVKLIDLGIARSTVPTHAFTLSGVLVGTPGFIAPEQARGDREVLPAVDIFALGCVLFECLTGKRMFTGSHMMAVLAKILIEDPPRVRELRPEVPDTIDLLIHRMVSKDPERRPRDGAELGRWLDDMLAAPPASIRTPPAMRITASEQRVVTVLVVVLPPPRAQENPLTDETRMEVDPLRSSAARFGVRVHVLAERTAIALAPEGFSASDQASLLARFGRHVVETFPGASVALATGSAITDERLPVGEAIDRGVTIVRKAPAGRGVHVDDVTAALITSRFDIKLEAGRLVIEDERMSLDPTRPLLGRATSCVGRDRELTILEATYAECVAGDGPKVVLVTGSAGLGKSRLRHELIRRLRAREEVPLVFQCRGDPLHLATPYAQIAHAVRQAAEVREREAPEIVREKLKAHVARMVPAHDVARVSDFLGEMIGAPFDDGDSLPLRAARQSAVAMTDQVRLAFEDLLRGWCAKHPVLLVLEDLHWGDAATVKLVDDVLRKLEGLPLMVLALARPEVQERFPTLWQKRAMTEVRLPPLPQRACAKLVQEAMGNDASAADVQRIVDRSEGNAFYLEELIRASAERVPLHASSSAQGSNRDDLPRTVIAVAQSRLERLEPDVRKVLRAASVFGETFSLEGVSTLVGEDSAHVAPILQSLVEHEAIVPTEEARLAGTREYVFRHFLLSSAAYATLTDEDRALGHRLAAEWLERVGEEDEAIAIHWLESGDRERGARTFASAAISLWARAQAEAAGRCAIRALLVGGVTRGALSEVADRVRLLADALAVSRRIDTRDILSGIERHILTSRPSEATSASPSPVHAAIRNALDAARSQPEDIHSATVLARCACALGALNEFTGVGRILEEAEQLAFGEESRIREIQYARARVAFWAGDYGTVVNALSATILPSQPRERLEMLLLLATAVVAGDGIKALDRGLDLVSRAEALDGAGRVAIQTPRSSSDPVAKLQCAKARMLCYYFAAQHAKAVKTAEEAVLLAREAGLRYEECLHLHNVGEYLLRLSDSHRAGSALSASTVIARDIGAERIVQHNELLMAYVEGRESRLEEIANTYLTARDAWHEMLARRWLGQLLIPSAADSARRHLTRALTLARDLKVKMLADECASLLETFGGS